MSGPFATASRRTPMSTTTTTTTTRDRGDRYGPTECVVSYLDVVLELEQRRLHDVPQHEVLGLDVEGVSGGVGDAVPVTTLHRLVGHHLEQRTALAEVVDLLLEVDERLPVLQALWQLLTPAPHDTSRNRHRRNPTNIRYVIKIKYSLSSPYEKVLTS